METFRLAGCMWHANGKTFGWLAPGYFLTSAVPCFVHPTPKCTHLFGWCLHLRRNRWAGRCGKEEQEEEWFKFNPLVYYVTYLCHYITYCYITLSYVKVTFHVLLHHVPLMGARGMTERDIGK